MSKQRLTTLALMLTLVAAAMVVGDGSQHADADATSLVFSPSVISLDGDGDSTTVSLEVTDLGFDAADTVQVNIQHDAQFTISAPLCGTIYAGGAVSLAIPVEGGTAFTCALQDGPNADGGIAASFTITKNGDVTGETVLTLLGGLHPFRTTFFEAGTEVLPGALGTLTVWDLLDPIGDQTVDENSTLTPEVVVNSTTDGVIPTLTATINGDPIPSVAMPFITFLDNFDNTGTFAVSPTFDDGGIYTVAVEAIGAVTETESFTLTVDEVNRSPVLTAITSPQTVAENASLNVPLSAADPDGDGLAFSATIDDGLGGGPIVLIPSVLTGFTTLTDNGDGSGSLDFTPGFFDEGAYTLEVTVTDDSTAANGMFDDVKAFTLTVTTTNQPPVIDTITDKSVNEGSSLDVFVTASDADTDLGHIPVISATLDGFTIPTSIASITPTGPGAATISFVTDFGDAGDYAIVVTADDGASGTDTESFTLTVNDLASIIAPPGTVTLQGLPDRGTSQVDHDAQFTEIVPIVELIRDSDNLVVDSMSVLVDGSFVFNGVTRDLYRLRIGAPGYFTHVLGNVPGQEIDLSLSDYDLGLTGENKPVMMLGGQITSGDVPPAVTGADLSALLDAFGDKPVDLIGRSDAFGNVVDINADGILAANVDGAVTAADLSILISNFGVSGDRPWQ